MIHSNSLSAYNHIEATVEKQSRLDSVLDCYQDGRAYTDRQVLSKLFPGSTDCNMVRPRVSEGIQKGLLEECGNTKDAATGKNVRLVRLRDREQQTRMF